MVDGTLSCATYKAHALSFFNALAVFDDKEIHVREFLSLPKYQCPNVVCSSFPWRKIGFRTYLKPSFGSWYLRDWLRGYNKIWIEICHYLSQIWKETFFMSSTVWDFSRKASIVCTSFPYWEFWKKSVLSLPQERQELNPWTLLSRGLENTDPWIEILGYPNVKSVRIRTIAHKCRKRRGHWRNLHEVICSHGIFLKNRYSSFRELISS